MSTPAPLPHFDRAEYTGDPPPPDKCDYCHRGIATEYFRVDGNMACTSCGNHAQSLVPPDSHKAFWRALLFGAVAALIGCMAYALLVIVTGWTIGYAAIGVGYLIGRAMKMGSRGLGGRRYQITAALLTYAAVAMAFVPIALHDFATRDTSAKTAAAQQIAPTHPSNNAAAAAGAPNQPVASRDTAASPYEADQPAATAEPPRKHDERKMSVGKFILSMGFLAGLGIVSPFLRFADSFGRGLLGLFIIFIGVSTAWKLTQRTASEVEGPFQQPERP